MVVSTSLYIHTHPSQKKTANQSVNHKHTNTHTYTHTQPNTYIHTYIRPNTDGGTLPTAQSVYQETQPVNKPASQSTINPSIQQVSEHATVRPI